MIWKDISDTAIYLLDHIWRKEQEEAPGWLRASAVTAGMTRQEFARWMNRDCALIMGLYAQESHAHPILIVYAERTRMTGLKQLHLSILSSLPKNTALALLELQGPLLEEGFNYLHIWVLQRNFALVDLLKSVGFYPRNLWCELGEYNGRPLKWRLMERKVD